MDSADDRRAQALRLPEYGAGFPSAIRRFFAKYATFSGRASRAEYWWWVLVATAVPVVIQVASGLIVEGPQQPRPLVMTTLLQLFAVATLIPGLAVTWRRLHDTDRSGLWSLVGLIPLAGWIVLLVFVLQPADPRGARYDSPPG